MTRKEAIEAIKHNWPDSSYSMLQEALETLIPELAESEDERIRKGLLETFKNAQSGEWGKLKIKDIIAWLEKQKEQKPLSTEEAELNSLAFLVQLGYTCIPPGAEQKSAEWSEEDDGMINCIISTLCEGSHGGRETNERMVSWLEKLRKSIRPSWKPSEEQMEALMLAIEGKCPSPTSYLSRRLEDLYEGLANTYGVEKEDEK